MKQIVQVSGKAKRVFKYIEVLGRNKGNTTLKQLEKDNKTLKLNLR